MNSRNNYMLFGLVLITLLVMGCSNREISKDNNDLTEESLNIESMVEDTIKETDQPLDTTQPESETEIETNDTTAKVQEETDEIIQTNGKIIVLDAGHSAVVASGTEPLGLGASEMKAKDSGGTSGKASGLKEYELNLQVTLKLREELVGRGYEVILTREDNETAISNIERAQVANDANADAFIRIHANGSDDTSVSGALTICQTSANPYVSATYEESRRLSDAILHSLSEATGTKNRGVWETDTMTGINWCQVPVTIVEMGFMTNQEEDMLMASDDYQVKIVQGIADGLDEFVNFSN